MKAHVKPETVPCPDCGERCEYRERLKETWGEQLTHWTREHCRCERDRIADTERERQARRLDAERNALALALRQNRERCRFEGIQWRQTFETFDPARDPLMGQAYRRIIAWCDAYRKGETAKGYVLSASDPDVGMYGCGKSHLVTAAGHVLLARGVQFQFYTVSDLLDEIRKDIGRQAAGRTLDAACSCDVLCLDDLGTETIRSGEAGDWVREQLFLIFDRRARRGLPLLATTNHATETLVERIGGKDGERIFSRLMQMASWVDVGGADWRLP